MKHVRWILGLLILGAGCIQAETKKPAGPKATPKKAPELVKPFPKPTKSLGFVVLGKMDAKQVEAFRKFTEFNLGVVTKQLPTQKPTGGTLEEEGKALKKLVTAEIPHVVALLPGNKDAETHLKVMKEDGVAIVNLHAIKDKQEVIFNRRIDRCMMRGYGFLMGLDPSPNPHSALFPYTGLKQLDMIGRNYDPPYLKKYQQAAQQNGFTFVEYPAMRLIK